MNRNESLVGKVVLITGATSGIGYHTATALARLGATVYVTGRDERRGRAAERDLRAAAGHDRVRFLQADASTVGGNQELARQMLREADQLHILVNNVGGTHNDRWRTKDGYEATLAVQSIGPFALTEALLPRLCASAPARIVNVSSDGHTMWKGDPFEDLELAEGYAAWKAYARSKLLGILWTFALARRLEGSGVVANACHPGMAWTAMTQGMAPRSMPRLLQLVWPLVRLLQSRGTPEQAARSSIYLARAPDAATLNGSYVGSNARPARPSPLALDRGIQERAWGLLTELVASAPTAVRAEREPTPSLPSACCAVPEPVL